MTSWNSSFFHTCISVNLVRTKEENKTWLSFSSCPAFNEPGVVKVKLCGVTYSLDSFGDIALWDHYVLVAL